MKTLGGLGSGKRDERTVWVRRILSWTPVLGTVLCGRIVLADLTHLYTFNDGSAADSVGNADGTLMGGTFIDADGILQLPGGPLDFVSLDGAGIGISSYTDVTLEAWFTVDQFATWMRVFDFGDRTVPASQQGYVYYTPQGGNGGGLAVYANFGQRTEAPHTSLESDHLYHLAMVIDDDADGGSNLMSVYLDGQLQTSVGHNRSLSEVSESFAYLGESLVVDPNFNGSIDEFRIYDHALDVTEVEENFSAGPTLLSTIQLVVNTVTGSVTLTSNGAAPTLIDYYSITSPGAALDPIGWSSLDDQDLDAIGSAEGQNWDEAALSDSTQLVELYLLGASLVTDGDPLQIGSAFNPSIFGRGEDGDLSFHFSRHRSGQLRGAEVQYVTPSILDGDYNQNGRVDAGDYTVWRDTFGSTTDLRADGDGNLAVNTSDYTVWQWTYGNTIAAASGATVPEPRGMLWATFAITLAVTGRLRIGPPDCASTTSQLHNFTTPQLHNSTTLRRSITTQVRAQTAWRSPRHL